MTGRQKIETALSEDGSPETPAVICYEDIYIRDRWWELTPCPWWYRIEPDLSRQVQWRRDVFGNIGQDWFRLPSTYSREERNRVCIEARPEGVFQVDRDTGREDRVPEPRGSGWSPSGGSESYRPAHPAETTDEIDARIPDPPGSDPADLMRDGRGDLAEEALNAFGEQYPIGHVPSPLWRCYQLWGFEGMMTRVATRPDLVKYACERYLALSVYAARQAAALGTAGIWIEECMTDMVSPRDFETLNIAFLIPLVAEIRALGMKSIYYFCGNPLGKWDLLLSAGADALALEESKKGFEIDIEDAVARVQGRCALLGNLDAIGVLQNGTEAQLRDEIARQMDAGRRNGGRFVMSTGSPVTPETPVERVRLYCDLTHELGGA